MLKWKMDIEWRALKKEREAEPEEDRQLSIDIQTRIKVKRSVFSNIIVFHWTYPL